MVTVAEIAAFLEQYAPSRLAADWDNVGLLVGDRHQKIERVMTCLTITPASAAEAIDQRADLVVAHHPLPFRALKRLTRDTTVGRMLLDLIGARIAVYSPHTAMDSAPRGINQRLAEGLGLEEIVPLVPDPQGQGAGRFGSLPSPITLGQMADRVKEFLAIERLQRVGDPEQRVQRIAVACGAAGEFLAAAHEAGCHAMLVGETNFHTCLEAEALGIGLVLPGHFASERFAAAVLAEAMSAQFPELRAWPSRRERDPLAWR